jgi:hypothetical protein
VNVSGAIKEGMPQIVSYGSPQERMIYIPDDNYKLIFKYQINLVDDGFVRRMVAYYNQERSKYKELSKDYVRKFQESKSEEDRTIAMMYDSMQAEAKVLNNTFYGVMAQKYYEIADLPAAILVTAIGRWIMREIMGMFKDAAIENDSVVENTPIYVRERSGRHIDIIPIEDLHSGNKVREKYKGNLLIYTRGGWRNIRYTKRRATTKNVHRLKCSDALVDCTSDHSVYDADTLQEISPLSIQVGDRIEMVPAPLIPVTSKYSDSFPLDRDTSWFCGLFLAEGSYSEWIGTRSENRNYKRVSRNLSISMSNIHILTKAMNICTEKIVPACDPPSTKGSWKNVGGLKMYDTINSSSTYRITGLGSKQSADFFYSHFYCRNKDHKKVPVCILNTRDNSIIESFLDGYFTGDGCKAEYKDKYTGTIRKVDSSDSVDKCLSAGIRFLLNKTGSMTTLSVRKDKQNVVAVKLRQSYRTGTFRKIDTNKVSQNFVLDLQKDTTSTVVYDVSTDDGTFVSALGGIVLHNTDGTLLDRSKFNSENSEIEKVNHLLRKKQHDFFGVPYDKMKFDLEFEGEGSVYVYKKKNYILRTNGSDKLITKGSAFTGYDKAPVIIRAVRIMSEAIMGLGEHANLGYNSALELAVDIRSLDLEAFRFSKILKKSINEYAGFTGLSSYAKQTIDMSSMTAQQAVTEVRRRARKFLEERFKGDDRLMRYKSLVRDCKSMGQLDLIMGIIDEVLSGNKEGKKKRIARYFVLDLILLTKSRGHDVEEDDVIEYYYTNTSEQYSIAEDVSNKDQLNFARYEKEIATILERFSLADPRAASLDLDLL